MRSAMPAFNHQAAQVSGAALAAQLEAAERAEAQSFIAARKGSLAMLKRKQEKRRLLAAVDQAREAVQMNLPFERGTN